MVRLSVPPEWKETAERALAAYAKEPEAWVVELTTEETADIHLVKEESGLVIRRDPLALAVPYTTDWQDIGLENAGQALEEGHDFIQVIPWRDLSPEMRALRVGGLLPDDPHYPLRQTWSLAAEEAFEVIAGELGPFLQEAGQDRMVHIAAVGDIMLDRSLGAALENGYLEYPFAETAAELQRADITIGNLESALGTSGQAAAKRYPFRAPPEAAQALAMAGFDIMSLANNHAADFGNEALLQAMELLEAQGIAPIGAGQNAQEAHTAFVHETNGLKTAFLSYVNVPVEATTGFDTATWTATDDQPGLAWAEPEAIKADVSTVPDDVDLIVVALHSGFEYQSAPSEPQIAAARAAIDAGADLVIGHHTHILQGIEFYNEGVILYGTGNFAFEIDGPPETAIFDIWLDENGVRQIAISPAIIQFGGQPRPAESWEEPAILNRVYRLSNILNAR